VKKRPDSFKTIFFAKSPVARSVIELFNALPQTYFYAKDRKSRFVKVNQQFLENLGLNDESEAIGKTDHDFHPSVMAEAYIAEDRRVMEGRKQISGQTWLVPHLRQVPRWYVSTKIPLFDPEGRVIGIAGAMYRIEQPQQLQKYFQELMPVVDYIEKHFSDSISMAEMAELAGLSSTHFNRRFKKLLRFTPRRYLVTIRVQAAQSLLATTRRELSDIAVSVGFVDQSHFTRRFRETTGMTPLAYRTRFVRDLDK